MHRRYMSEAAALAIGFTLASVISAFGAVLVARLAPGSAAMTLSNASTLPSGPVQSTWQAASGMTD